MTTHHGSCLCGAVRFEIKGDFDSFFLCHCKHCQKDTGSAHAANLFSQSAQLTWRSGEEAVTSFTLPDSRHSKSFCKHCGSALPNTQNEGLLMVPAGCLDTEVPLKPSGHIFIKSKAKWETRLTEMNTALARGWIEAWVRMDMEWLREHLASNFEHVSPFGRLAGRDHYLEVVEPMARKSVQRLEIKNAMSDENHAAVWFENTTANGPIPSCDWLTIEGGKITSIQSFYDSAKVREVLSESEQDTLRD